MRRLRRGPTDLGSWAADLTPRLGSAVHGAARGLLADQRPGEVVGLGLWTDADCVTIAMGACTRAHLAELVSADPDDPTCYRWAPQEWDLEDDAEDPDAPLAPVAAELQVAGDRFGADDAGLAAYRRVVPDLLAGSLLPLRTDGTLDDHPDLVLVVEVGDELRREDAERWVRMLDPPAAAAELARWAAAEEEP
ncbi:DUF4303 domain-containing protein [Nocardioides litoris]|uniref:DUF4303 domain-containing protein n=1 Tax=Nocardioides litoris TaxID=1926648 RepID=UPI001476E0E1|nr:DUF4303 domain-containing protein [Nocardioides litoris]